MNGLIFRVEHSDMQIKKKDGTRILSLLFIAASAFFYYLTYSFPKELGAVRSEYGSAFFPRFLLGFIAIIAVILLVQASLRKGKATANELVPMGRQQLSSSLAIWVLCMGFYWVWYLAGYLPSSILFTVALGLILGVRKIFILVPLAAIGPLMYLIFEGFLKVGL